MVDDVDPSRPEGHLLHAPSHSMSENGQLDEQTVVVPSASVHVVELDGEAVLLDQVSNRLHHLNPTATAVWHALDGRSTVREIARDLAGRFRSDEQEVLQDALDLLRGLASEDLIEPISDERAR